MYKTVILVVASAILLLLFPLCTTKTPVAPDAGMANVWRSPVSSLTAWFDPSIDRVRLTWARVENVNGYRIYRTSKRDSSGLPDTNSLLGSPLIVSTATTYEDVIEPGSATYFYAIRGIKVDGNDTIEGELSPAWPGFISCTVGLDVRFSIQRGDIFIASRSCTLFVDDPKRVVAKVQFTQLVTKEIKTATGWVPFRDTATVNTAKDPDSIGLLIKNSKFLKRTGSKVDIRETPVFGGVDTINPVGEISVTQSQLQIVWQLLPKMGQKNIYAKIIYSENGISPDTFMDFINTKPHRMEIILRSSKRIPEGADGGPDAPTKDTSDVRTVNNVDVTVPIHVFYYPTIKFSIRNFSDTAVAQDFKCWLVMSNNELSIDNSFPSNKAWVMTRAAPYRLTGLGDAHSSSAVYEYCFDKTREVGTANLNFIRLGKSLSVDTVVTSSVSKNYENITFLSSSERAMDLYTAKVKAGGGKKQFLIMTKFYDRVFDDNFLAVFGYTDTLLERRSCLDVYPPAGRIDWVAKTSIYYLDSNSVITVPFNFALKGDTGTVCVVDAGFSIITDLSLMIARKPDFINWSDAAFRNSFTVEAMEQIPNQLISIPIKPGYSIPPPIRWTNIDPKNWPSGKYIFGIVAKDEFGKKSFLDVLHNTGLPLNPFLVNVQAGN